MGRVNWKGLDRKREGRRKGAYIYRDFYLAFLNLNVYFCYWF